MQPEVPPSAPVKLCEGCARWLPLSAFPSAFDKKRPQKIKSKCRAYCNQISAIWRSRNPRYHGEYNAALKRRNAREVQSGGAT